MIYVFVGTPEMVKAGKPFVVVDQFGVWYDGLDEFEWPKTNATFKTSRRPKVFRCENGDTYHAHAWVELS